MAKGKKGSAGRPTSLTPEVHAKIVDCIRKGNYRHVAAKFAGISDSTLKSWVAKGKKEPEGPHGKFLNDMLAAETEAEIRAVERVLADPDVKHTVWWLTCKFPDRWSKDRGIIAELTKRIKALEVQNGVYPPPSSETSGTT